MDPILPAVAFLCAVLLLMWQWWKAWFQSSRGTTLKTMGWVNPDPWFNFDLANATTRNVCTI